MYFLRIFVASFEHICLFILHIPFPILSCSAFLTDYCQPKRKRGSYFFSHILVATFVALALFVRILAYICLLILYIPFPLLSCIPLLTDYCQPKEKRGSGFFGAIYLASYIYTRSLGPRLLDCEISAIDGFCDEHEQYGEEFGIIVVGCNMQNNICVYMFNSNTGVAFSAHNFRHKYAASFTYTNTNIR